MKQKVKIFVRNTKHMVTICGLAIIQVLSNGCTRCSRGQNTTQNTVEARKLDSLIGALAKAISKKEREINAANQRAICDSINMYCDKITTEFGIGNFFTPDEIDKINNELVMPRAKNLLNKHNHNADFLRARLPLSANLTLEEFEGILMILKISSDDCKKFGFVFDGYTISNFIDTTNQNKLELHQQKIMPPEDFMFEMAQMLKPKNR